MQNLRCWLQHDAGTSNLHRSSQDRHTNAETAFTMTGASVVSLLSMQMIGCPGNIGASRCSGWGFGEEISPKVTI
ncbi:hypothetical protein A9Q94_20435 [Rhodobacterales bacterium 56_14_T64]|nr:hypothetical protein A9Q94_20435 [Rhodobacterales bacterium 56_14_T64]